MIAMQIPLFWKIWRNWICFPNWLLFQPNPLILQWFFGLAAFDQFQWWQKNVHSSPPKSMTQREVFCNGWPSVWKWRQSRNFLHRNQTLHKFFLARWLELLRRLFFFRLRNRRSNCILYLSRGGYYWEPVQNYPRVRGLVICLISFARLFLGIGFNWALRLTDLKSKQKLFS